MAPTDSSKKATLVTREYTINLGKLLHRETFKKKAPKAIKAVRAVLAWLWSPAVDLSRPASLFRLRDGRTRPKWPRRAVADQEVRQRCHEDEGRSP